MIIPMLPGKYHQNGGFSIAMLGKPEGNLQDMSWLDGSPQKTGSF